MATENGQIEKENDAVKKQSFLRKAAIAALVLMAFISICGVVVLAYNNISFTSDKAFVDKLNTSIEKGLAWTEDHKGDILKRKNIALIKMLKEIEGLNETAMFSDIINSFMATPSRPRCWKGLVDPNWSVDELELNITIKKEYLDNKWVLYAMAPDKAKVTGEELSLFEPDK